MEVREGGERGDSQVPGLGNWADDCAILRWRHRRRNWFGGEM